MSAGRNVEEPMSGGSGLGGAGGDRREPTVEPHRLIDTATQAFERSNSRALACWMAFAAKARQRRL
ncbi:hypothetical protein AXG89_35045 [Burkholderia sp. PAMC 26561]|nr:hypothetical protein AXG89_35045 [Burkholderia sp. PAMC 26561]